MHPEPADSPNRSLRLPDLNALQYPKKGKNCLLAIAIDNYAHVGKLSNAVNDARALIGVLTQNYEFEPEHIQTLFDEEATYEAIDKALREMPARIEAGKDNVLIFFSGHGHYDEHLDDAFWAPVDARFDRTRDYFPYDRLMRHVRAIPSLHTFLIVDSCYSGSVLVRERANVGARLEKDPSRWILASGRNEVVPDGVKGGNSPFTEQLVHVLRRNAHEELPVMSLVDQVTRNTIYNSRQTPIGQPIQDVGHQGGQFIFHPRKNETASFEAATAKGTGDAYRQFLALFPNGKHAEQASWLLAKTVDNAAEYRAYLDSWPSGSYVQEALEALARCEDRQHFEQARRQGEAALRRYILTYPQGRYIDEAQQEIDNFSRLAALADTLPKHQAPAPAADRAKWALAGIAVIALVLALIGFFGRKKSPPSGNYAAYQFFVQQGDSVLTTGNNRFQLDLAFGFYKLAAENRATDEVNRKIASVVVQIAAWDDSLRRQRAADSLRVVAHLENEKIDLSDQPEKSQPQRTQQSRELLRASEQALDQGNPQLAEQLTRRAVEMTPSPNVSREAETLKTRISDERRYQELVSRGDEALKNGLFEEAGRLFMDARKIRQTPELEERILATRTLARSKAKMER